MAPKAKELFTELTTATVIDIDAVLHEDAECSAQHKGHTMPFVVVNQSVSEQPPTNAYVLNVAFWSFLGFLVFEAAFAVIANSQSMLADAEAMAIDALTYVLNLWAERVKNRKLSGEFMGPEDIIRQNYQRELQHLYLEIIPPLLSAVALIAVTVVTLREAWSTLFGDIGVDGKDDVSVPLMFIFSGANLLLDVVNVTCFARAHSAFGMDVFGDKKHNRSIENSIRTSRTRTDGSVVHEGTALLSDVESPKLAGSDYGLE
jgi:Co/Zn/Cd efflux system component